MADLSCKGEGASGGGSKGNNKSDGGPIAKLDSFLCNEGDQEFPSDSEGSHTMEVSGAAATGREKRKLKSEGKVPAAGERKETDYKLEELLKSNGTLSVVKGQVGKHKKKGGGVQTNQPGPGENSGTPPGSPQHYQFSRNAPVTLTTESFRSKRPRLSPITAGSSKDIPPPPASNDNLPVVRKRRPRLEYSLRLCRDFINDVLSKKHKDWTWPFHKSDKGQRGIPDGTLFLMEIKTKLNDRIYNSADEFFEDVRNLINYFYSLNQSEHPSANGRLMAAKKLNDMFEELIAKVRELDGDRDQVRKRSSETSLPAEHAQEAVNTTVNDNEANERARGMMMAGLGQYPIDFAHGSQFPGIGPNIGNRFQRNFETPVWNPWSGLPPIARDLSAEQVRQLQLNHFQIDYFNRLREGSGAHTSASTDQQEIPSGGTRPSGSRGTPKIDLSIVKQEPSFDEEDESRGTTDERFKLACKSIVDIIQAVDCAHLRAILGWNQDFVPDWEYLEGLNLDSFKFVVNFVVGRVMSFVQRAGATEHARDSHTEMKIVNDLSDAVTGLAEMHGPMLTLRKGCYELLEHMNTMENRMLKSTSEFERKKSAVLMGSRCD